VQSGAVPTIRDADADPNGPDVNLVIGWRADPGVNEWYGGLDEADAASIRADWQDPWCQRGIIELDGRAVGYIQWYQADADIERAYHLPPGPAYWGIDLFIGLPERFGQGIGTAAVRMLSDRLLDDGVADTVVIDPRRDNARAIRCYEKAGFTYAHDLPHHELHDGVWYDGVLLIKRSAPTPG
jgi:aminoglycoside 6'-N-acetyltransferase